MKIFMQGLSTSWKLFGFSPNFLFFAGVILSFMVHNLFTITTLFLDQIFCPGFRSARVKNPVFIIGHPRSGTTFVHHLFTQTGDMASFTTWQLLFPALTARAVIRPVVRFLTSKKPCILVPEETGHMVGLDTLEEEERLFLHNQDSQFMIIGTPLGFAQKDFRKIRFHDLQPRKKRIGSAEFLKSLFQRHVYYTGKTQIFAQTHFSTHRIQTLMEVFPDAKFIYMHRMPHETLPSYLSLNYNTLDFLWGMHRFSKSQKNTYYKRRYTASLELYKYFHDLWHDQKIDRKRVMIIPYESLKKELVPVFDQIVEFTGIQPTRKLREKVVQQARHQKSYQRRHRIRTLEYFGISERRMHKDFDFLYANDPFGIKNKS